MSLVVTTAGESVLLGSMLGKASLLSVTYHLYANNYLPQQSDTLANYTELALTGYAPIVVTGQTWTIVADSQGGAIATAPAIAWVISQAGPCYGYYVTDPGNTVVLWAEAIPGGPFNFLSNGSSLSLVPSFSAD